MASQAPQPQAQPHQPTDADYQALLASISSESPALTPEAMSILPRFSHMSGADLEAHRVPQHVIAFVEQNREQLQRAAQDQSGFRAGITSFPVTSSFKLNGKCRSKGKESPIRYNPTSYIILLLVLPCGHRRHSRRMHPTYRWVPRWLPLAVWCRTRGESCPYK